MSSYFKIPLEKLTDGTIIDIADELGCEIDCPSIKFNKYLDKIIKDSEEGIKDEELINLYNKENKKLVEESNKEFDKYIEDIKNWLIENYGEEMKE